MESDTFITPAQQIRLQVALAILQHTDILEVVGEVDDFTGAVLSIAAAIESGTAA